MQVREAAGCWRRRERGGGGASSVVFEKQEDVGRRRGVWDS
jgi:hypothetical protein